MVVLGLDIGTTGSKGVAFDSEGKRLAETYRPYRLIGPRPGYFELVPSEVLDATEQVISETAKAVGKGSIKAIASSALGEAVVPIGRDNQPLYNSITPIDGRARKQITLFKGLFDEEAFFKKTGQLLHPILTLAKILWWKDQCPDVFSSAKQFVCWNEMLSLALGLDTAISPSLAARTGMYDLQRENWAGDILELAQLDPSKLARIVPAGEVIGSIPSSKCEQLGLARDCVLVSGGWDQSCSALGAGAIKPGIVVNSMGSTDSLNASFDEINTSEAMRKSSLTCNPHVVDGLYCSNAFSLSGGNLVRWLRERMGSHFETVATESGCDFYDLLVDQAETSKHPCLVLPHFSGTGTPYMDAESMGAVLGLSLATEVKDIAQGILLGIAFEMALNLDCLSQAGLPVDTILAGGGAAKNRKLVQMRSDIFNRPITILEVEEVGCTACAMLATRAIDSSINLSDQVKGWIQTGETMEPIPEKAERYREYYELYRQIYPAVSEIHRKWGKMTEGEHAETD